MALGYCPFLLQHLKQVVAENNPSTKITPTGFLLMLLQNNPSVGIPEHERMRLANATGHEKTIRLKYRKRIIPSQTQQEDNCDNNLIPFYNETQLSAPKFRSFSTFMEDAEISKYCEDASATVAIGQPATPFMADHLMTVMESVNGLVGAMDADLLSSVVWGKNQVTGVNTSTTVNVNKNATVNALTTGLTKIITDARQNEFHGELLIAGSGLMDAFEVQKSFVGIQNSGLDNSRIGGYKWYFDIGAATAWGANQMGVFSKGSIGFVDLDKYLGFRAGQKGNSFYFRLQLPTVAAQSDGTAELITFDAQLRYLDCPTTIFNGYDEVTVKRGWQLIISKNFGLFQVPDNAYQDSDRLTGNNGALRYTLTNECEECEE